MFSFFQHLFDTEGFPPRWTCGDWSAGHGWLHILSDLAIAGAYGAIPILLVYFIRKRKDVPFTPIFWLFAAFIISCGFGHLVESTIFWHPWYRFSGLIKVLTAAVSWLTVFALYKAIPQALALPGLAKVNQRLTREIEERKQVEESLRENKRQLSEAQVKLQAHSDQLEKIVDLRTAALHETISELQHFSYAIVHDLRSPLRALEGYAVMIDEELKEGKPELSQEYVRRMKIAAQRMDSLITDSLNYSKISQQELTLQPVDLLQLLDGMVQTYPNLRPETARIRIDPKLPVVLGNAAALTQCFSNLLQNAIKFSKEGEKPDIHIFAGETPASAGKGFVRISVEDKGVGIEEEWKERIFNLFQRARSDRDGTGLGLAIVRKVVERMGGKVGMESEMGEGSRFWVELQRYGG